MTQIIHQDNHITANELTTIILVGTLSVATLLVLPILVTGSINGLGLSPEQAWLVMSIDQSGKAMVLSGTATGIGVAGGPMIAAMLLDTHGFNAINVFSAAACLLSLALMVVALLWLREYRKA
ncbi:MAG: hypothetical protein ABJG88_11300 [Litorimonas sp.]